VTLATPSSHFTFTHCTRGRRYALNVYFNLLNKSIFKYFPFPYTVSTVHVVVGTAYCALVYLLGMKKLSFGRVGNVSTAACILMASFVFNIVLRDCMFGLAVYLVASVSSGGMQKLCCWA
jgi:hypothetical protein